MPIKSIKARQIKDSRGNPTVEVKLNTGRAVFVSKVPSGASTGKYEAVELRDDDKGVSKAIQNIEEIIGPKLIGLDPANQKEIDDIMIGLDATENKSRLGANAILAVSMAVCRAGARTKGIPLYQHISEISSRKWRDQISNSFLAKPIFNIINGGAHKKGTGLDIQEFIIIPQEDSFKDNLKQGVKIYNNLKNILNEEFGKEGIKTGDEGGFVPLISKTEEALNFIFEAGEDCSGLKLGLDCAASQFFKDNKYAIDGKELNNIELANYYLNLIKKYPIIYLEDPFAEEDIEGWKLLKGVGDDLTVTNKKRIEMAIKENLINGVIIKLNQVGTVSETLEAVKIAKQAGLKITVSHRSGETDDDFIADLAVGVGADYLKSGAPSPKERLAKYNRMVKIEKQLNN